MSRPGDSLAAGPTAVQPMRWAPAPARVTPPPRPVPRLWLHVHLPQLPLEVLARGLEPDRACVLVDTTHRHPRVLLTNVRAAALGIRAGMPLAAAHALGTVHVCARQAEAERQALEQVCQWAMRFTPCVSPVAPDGLLLEIGASLRLFGGVDALSRGVRRGLRELGYRADYAIAPTPAAATVLARSKPRTVIPALPQLAGQLNGLPLTALRLPAAWQAALASLGVDTVGACRRLPRAGLGRRLDPGINTALGQLYGELPDPRPAWVLPPRFEAVQELPWEAVNSRELLVAATRLLHELEGFLFAGAVMTRRLTWQLRDARGEEDHRIVELNRPVRRVRDFMAPVRETFARLRCARAVCRLTLRVEALEAEAPPVADLFAPAPPGTSQTCARFGDLLHARWAGEVLRGLGARSGHPPERTVRWQRPVFEGMPAKVRVPQREGLSRRPLWLLPRAVRLVSPDGRPWLGGRLLRLRPERERIQSGWWDGAGVDRDYFIAINDQGAHLWVYRELGGARDWYLHGVFD